MELTTKIVIEVLTLPSITALGCVTAYIYSEQKEVKSSQSFLRRFFPERLDVFYFRLDFFMTAVIGTAIGLLLYVNGCQEALFSGCEDAVLGFEL